jgi:hypothetical protein
VPRVGLVAPLPPLCWNLMSRPSRTSDPDGWERSWQADLDKRLVLYPRMAFFPPGSDEHNRRMMTEDGHHGLSVAHQVCDPRGF